MRLTKGHGTGNDFLLLADPNDEFELTAELVRALCDRRFGIGADGLIRAIPSQHADAPWFMDHWNSDGSIGIMCGNGARVFGRYLVNRGLAPAGRLIIETRGGVRTLEVPPVGDVTVDMGPANRRGSTWTRLAGQRWVAEAVDMPNPHAVTIVESLAVLPDRLSQPDVDPAVFPGHANVEFVQILAPDEVRMRVYERGAGETMSCGTGACATATVVAARAGVIGPIRVHVDGGTLTIDPTAESSGSASATVLMTGPAELVADLDVDVSACRIPGPH